MRPAFLHLSTQEFSSLYNLVSHHDQWVFKEHAYKAFFALFFVRCLQKSDYFGALQSSGKELGREELLIGGLMTHVMEVATMNAHELGQMEAEAEQNWLLGQTKPVGCALEPTLVLLNHSCDPTLIRSIKKIPAKGMSNIGCQLEVSSIDYVHCPGCLSIPYLMSRVCM